MSNKSIGWMVSIILTTLFVASILTGPENNAMYYQVLLGVAAGIAFSAMIGLGVQKAGMPPFIYRAVLSFVVLVTLIASGGDDYLTAQEAVVRFGWATRWFLGLVWSTIACLIARLPNDLKPS